MKYLFTLLALATSLFGRDFTVTTSEELYFALKSAENNLEDDTITLKKGRYIATDKHLFVYESSENFDLTLEAESGARRSDVVIDGNGLSSVLTFRNETYKIIVNILNITIQNGDTAEQGGGILMDNIGELNLDGVTVAYNKSKYDGAGVYNLGTVIVNESIIARNESLRGVGGGVFTGRNAIIKLSQISYNKSYKHGGGVFSTKTALVKDSTISYNQSSYGGAFYGLSKLKATQSIFTNNSAKYDGGAIKCDKVRLFDVNLSNNSANNYGGAIYSTRVNLDDSSLFENSAKYGGAILSDEIEIKGGSIFKNSADYSGGALKGVNVIVKDANLSYNTSRRDGGAIETTQAIISNSELSDNSSKKGGAIFGKRVTITNSTFNRNRSAISGGAVKGYDLKIRYTTMCENRSEKFGGAIDGVDVTVTNSNLSKNVSYKGGAIYSPHTSKLDLTNSLMFYNKAYYGGALFGNVKIFNSLLLNNYAKGMTLYGKGTLINNVIKNFTAPDVASQEIFMTGNLKLENNYLNMGNIYNYQMYKLKRKGNLPLSQLEEVEDLSSVFGEQSHIASVGLSVDFRSSCEEIFNVKNAYESLLENALIDVNGDDDNDTIVTMKRDDRGAERSSMLADISDLMVEGDQKVFNELYLVVIVRSGKHRVEKYFIDFDEGRGYEEIRGNSVNHRFHNSGIKDIKVKIVDSAGNIVEREFPVDIYELSQDEFRELLSDTETREYLENISKGVLNVAEDMNGSKYSSAVGLFNRSSGDSEYLKRRYGALLSELNSESASSNEFNISKMVQFNNGVNEVKEYILSNLEEFNLVSREESKDAIENAKKYIVENPSEFNLTSFRNYEEIIIDIQHQIMSNLDEYNLTHKKNLDVAYSEGQEKVISNPKAFNLMSMNDLQGEMRKLTDKIKADPSKYGIKVTREVVQSLDKGWSLLGTLAEIEDISIFDGAKIVWIFAEGEFKGYSPDPDVRRKIRGAYFELFSHVPKNAGIWLYK
jgi:predicted outer membrane repeat protein